MLFIGQFSKEQSHDSLNPHKSNFDEEDDDDDEKKYDFDKSK